MQAKPTFADLVAHLRLCENLTNTVDGAAASLGVTPSYVHSLIYGMAAKSQIRPFRLGRTVYLRAVVSHFSWATEQEDLARADARWSALADQLGLRYEDAPRSVNAARVHVRISAPPIRSITGSSMGDI